jgi:hypothetical protein
LIPTLKCTVANFYHFRKVDGKLPDKFVVEFIVAARGGKECVAVRDEQVKNDCGLKEKNIH